MGEVNFYRYLAISYLDSDCVALNTSEIEATNHFNEIGSMQHLASFLLYQYSTKVRLNHKGANSRIARGLSMNDFGTASLPPRSAGAAETQ